MNDTPTKVLFPGTFDPFTKGHADIVERALRLFDHIVIAIGINEGKTPMQTVEQRQEAIRQLYAHEPRVEVCSYSGLTIDLAHQCGIRVIVRGVRSLRDYEYERDIADVNARISDVETVLLFARPELAAISSTVVRELQHYHKDTTPFQP